MAESKEAKRLRLAHNRRIAKQDDNLVKISQCIAAVNMPMAELSRKCGGVTVNTLKRYRSLDTYRPSYSTLKFVAKGLGLEFKLMRS